ncbi:MAG: hypothetical protein DCF20_09905 [Pseudanabaena sp.]|nr:MAG: hypothetical protein DCF20_09905 [Pseudanabaena sp.]
MIEILVKVLGWQMVSQALRNRESAKNYSAQNPMLVLRACKTLSDYWLNGNPREYLESLDTDLRNCLICNLASDISADAIADMGLMEV